MAGERLRRPDAALPRTLPPPGGREPAVGCMVELGGRGLVRGDCNWGGGSCLVIGVFHFVRRLCVLGEGELGGGG